MTERPPPDEEEIPWWVLHPDFDTIEEWWEELADQLDQQEGGEE